MTQAAPGKKRNVPNFSRGQQMVEYGLLIAIVVAGLLGAKHYLRRAMEGRMHMIGENFGFGYAPKRTKAELTLSLQRTQKDTFTSNLDPADPETYISFVISDIQQDRTKLDGKQTVDEDPSSKLFN